MQSRDIPIRDSRRYSWRLSAPNSLAESLGSEYMHDSQRDSLRDSFFLLGYSLPLSISTCRPRTGGYPNCKYWPSTKLYLTWVIDWNQTLTTHRTLSVRCYFHLILFCFFVIYWFLSAENKFLFDFILLFCHLLIIIYKK